MKKSAPSFLRRGSRALPALMPLPLAVMMAVNTQTAAAQGAPEAALEEVVVTGSRLARGNAVSPSPVTTVDATDIEARGTIRVEDMLNVLPQVSPSETASKANEATGTATVDLRGLGAERTLVLVNGRRLPLGSPVAPAADLNQVPSQLVERVEVLTGGASAVYGADAVAGVVNFILKDDFEGIQVDLQYGGYQTENEYDKVEPVLQEFNQPIPGSTYDGESYNVSIMAGLNAEDGRGNITGYFTYRKQDEVLQGERIGSACAFGTRNAGQEFTCAGSSTTNPARFLNGGPVANPFDFTLDSAGNPRPFQNPEDTYNFAPLNNYIQPNERWTFGAIGHYDINEKVEAYGEFGYATNEIVDQIAPAGIFPGQTTSINCDNPFLSDELVDVICTSNGFGPGDDAPLNIARRNVEGGGRMNTVEHSSFRLVGGLRGEINEIWSYDVSAQYAQVDYSNQAENFFNISQVEKALEVRIDPATGQPACQSVIDGSDPSCVPYNPFQLGGVTQGALDYVQAPGFREGTVKQKIFMASVTGDLGAYGVKSPMADDGLLAVFGLEYRKDELSQTNDFLTRTGALGNPRADVAGQIPVKEFFMEAQMPLVQGAKGVEDLSITGAYRFSDFEDTTGDQDTYAFGVSYSPNADIRLRAQYQRATRSPNPIELFAPNNRFEFNLPELANGTFDPCSGPNPFRSAEECARTGVTAAQYGQVADSIGGQFNNLQGGNENLDVETSDTYTVGLVFTPSFIEDLTVSIDYFQIEVEDFIATVPEQTALNNCLDTGDTFFCSLIQRDPNNGRLWGNENAFITATNVNTGSLETSGVDVSATYGFDMGKWGSLRVNYIATFLDTLEKVPLPGEPAIDCVGFFSSNRAQCGVSSPEYRHQMPVIWNTPWNDITARVSWRHFGGADLLGTGGNVEAERLGARDYFDVALRGTIMEGIEFRAGINNILDRQPPLSNQVGGAGGSFGTGNTFPGVYDALGRFMFVGTTFTF
jgi:outer membrane receptor protein involved in Fe transport